MNSDWWNQKHNTNIQEEKKEKKKKHVFKILNTANTMHENNCESSSWVQVSS